MTAEKQNKTQPNFMKMPDAAKRYGIKLDTVHIWARQGKLATYRDIDNTNLVRPSELVDLMQSNGMYVPPEWWEQDRGKDHEKRTAEDGSTVLVVDDDAMVRGMIVQILNNLYPLCQAQTGFEALHLITMRKDIKVVLLDIRMPGQSGVETYKEIKKLRPDITIVVVSGYIEDVSDDMMADPSVTGIIEKPVDEETLIETVVNAMANSVAC